MEREGWEEGDRESSNEVSRMKCISTLSVSLYPVRIYIPPSIYQMCHSALNHSRRAEGTRTGYLDRYFT